MVGCQRIDTARGPHSEPCQGLLSGTPTAQGTSTFNVTVTDSEATARIA